LFRDLAVFLVLYVELVHDTVHGQAAKIENGLFVLMGDQFTRLVFSDLDQVLSNFEKRLLAHTLEA